ncbi:sigma 54-interacting transcriptional regulator [Sodalis sp. C49]|uniref:sigma 54-interacting transcriptional regulator n=1 Tax=Sodalis sp. C49 TaxID=3228929 RepID=UPI0039659229
MAGTGDLAAGRLAIPRCAVDLCGPAGKARSRKGRGGHAVDQIIAHSHAMKRTLAAVANIAPTRSAVLLRGEPGTGKDVIARAIHLQSQHRAGPFIKVCCDYLASDDIMRELFGCEAGFSGSVAGYPGDIALAAGGTLFISEIGHFSLLLQKRLLRILQEQRYKPLGGSRTLACDVRIICATEKNLEQRMAQGTFLAELYYRIHIATIALPALRERKEDIPGLVNYFFERYNRDNHRTLTLTEAAQAPLYLCHWPGNVRDIENCLEHAAIQARDGVIQQLPCLSGRCLRQRLNQEISRQQETVPQEAGHEAGYGPATPLWPAEIMMSAMTATAGAPDDADEELRYRLVAALEKSGGVKAKAARLLHITPRQLYYALKKLHIEVKKF